MAIYTLVCLAPSQWIVVEDEGYVDTMARIPVKPASSREGSVVFGPGPRQEASLFIANRNHLGSNR
jgi:hypothetical protein